VCARLGLDAATCMFGASAGDSAVAKEQPSFSGDEAGASTSAPLSSMVPSLDRLSGLTHSTTVSISVVVLFLKTSDASSILFVVSVAPSIRRGLCPPIPAFDLSIGKTAEVLSGLLSTAGADAGAGSFVSTAPAVRELRSTNMASNSSPFCCTLTRVSRAGIEGAAGVTLGLDKSGTLEISKIGEHGLSFKWDSVPMRFVFLFLKLYSTIAFGALFFKLQSDYGPSDYLSWIDCFYWATVVSTSVGYGDIAPSTYGGKLFLTFYMVFSTIITAQVLGSMISLYVNDVVAGRIVAKLIDSTIWVHKVDISDPSDTKNYGQITEADFGKKSVLLFAL